jgi:hypothetical protein
MQGGDKQGGPLVGPASAGSGGGKATSYAGCSNGLETKTGSFDGVKDYRSMTGGGITVGDDAAGVAGGSCIDAVGGDGVHKRLRAVVADNDN